MEMGIKDNKPNEDASLVFIPVVGVEGCFGGCLIPR